MGNKILQSGFSLIDMLAVIAIAGILAVIAIPAYDNFRPQLELNAAARSLVADLRSAQELAVARQVDYAVSFDAISNKYRLIESETDTAIKEKTLADQIKIISLAGLSNNRIIFNSAGAAVSGGAITLQNSSNQQKTVEIKPSGYVKVY